MNQKAAEIQFGPFAQRFEKVETLYFDPGFSLLKAWDRESCHEVSLQLLYLATLEGKESLPLQWEALKACRDSLWVRPQEWLEKNHYGILINSFPQGRYFNEIQGTLEDEVYLKWLKHALQDLGQLHRRGILHLSQNEKTWILFKSDEIRGEETMGLGEIGLLTEVPLGQMMTPPAAVAIAPEILRGENVDGRADLYALACLILRQRSSHDLTRLTGLKELLELHWEGRMLDFVPDRETTLNDALRKMLQPNPQDRPANVMEALQLIGEEVEPYPKVGSFPNWSRSRIEGRKITIILNSLNSLLANGETRLSGAMLDYLEDFLSETHEAYLRFLQSKLARMQGKDEEAKEWRRQATVKIYTQPDPKLKTLLALEEAQVCQEQGELRQSQEFLGEAWEAIAQYPEPHLRLKVLYARGKTHKALGQDLAALKELKTAFDQLPAGDRHPSKGEVYAELGELLNNYGLPRQAGPLMEQSLALLEEDPKVRARRFLQGALNSMTSHDQEKADERFREARLTLSALKDLAGVTWAGAHAVRLPLGERDYTRARRELKALCLRNRKFHYHETLLDLLELNLWLATDQTLSARSEKLFERMNDLARETLEGKIFCDVGWPPYQTCFLLDEVYQKLGKYKEAAKFHQMGQERHSEVTEQLKAMGYSEEKPFSGVESMVSVQSLKVQSLLEEPEVGVEKEQMKDEASPGDRESLWKKHAHYLEEQIQQMKEVREGLLTENRRLNQEIEQLKEQLKQLTSRPRRKPATPPSPKVAEEPSTTANESEEREKIYSALQEYQGNRSKAAKALGIHRRTLLEKIKKFGLEDVDFLPSKEEMERVLQECGGKKSAAAKKLGMSRSSFYRRLKEFGLSD